MKWWLRHMWATAHGSCLRAFGIMPKNTITVRELISEAERNPDMRWRIERARALPAQSSEEGGK